MWQALCEVPELRREATQPGTRADLRDLPFSVGGSYLRREATYFRTRADVASSARSSGARRLRSKT